MARTKEYRRFKKSIKLERRIRIYADTKWRLDIDGETYASYRKSILKGEKETWMRNTGVHCSCYMCSGYYKYSRPTYDEINRMITDELPINFKRTSKK